MGTTACQSVVVVPETSLPTSAALISSGAVVKLHLYDLGPKGETAQINRVLRRMGTGAFHCGVEVLGWEWSFCRRGIFCCRPCRCEHHSYSESITMAQTALAEASVLQLVHRLEKEWPGTSYDLLRRNCCHFGDSFCRNLGVGCLPRWITSLAAIGAAVANTTENFDQGVRSVAERLDTTDCCCVSGVCGIATCTVEAPRRHISPVTYTADPAYFQRGAPSQPC